MLCAKFQVDLTADKDVIEERDLTWFECKMRFGRISYSETDPGCIMTSWHRHTFRWKWCCLWCWPKQAVGQTYTRAHGGIAFWVLFKGFLVAELRKTSVKYNIFWATLLVTPQRNIPHHVVSFVSEIRWRLHIIDFIYSANYLTSHQ